MGPVPILSIQVSGSPQIVFDHSRDGQQGNSVPDAQVTAWKDKNGTVSLIVSNPEEYRMTGPDLHSVKMSSAEIYSSAASANQIPQNDFNYAHWFNAPYTLDGVDIYTLSHSEWYACLLVGDCWVDPTNIPGAYSGIYFLYSWVTTLNSFVSKDGGATFTANSVSGNHVVLNLGYEWTNSLPLKDLSYHQYFDYTGVTANTRIIREGSYFYALGAATYRDTSDVLSGNVTKQGTVIFRTDDITNPNGWQIWISGSTYGPISGSKFGVFNPQDANGNTLNLAFGQIIFDMKSNQYIFIMAPFGTGNQNQSSYYVTTPSLANPQWSSAVEILGSANFMNVPPNSGPYSGSYNNPSAPYYHCNVGFSDSSYLSVLDESSPGFNFEFANGTPEIYYVFNPALCGDPSQADRDIYRVSLKINYNYCPGGTTGPDGVCPQ